MSRKFYWSPTMEPPDYNSPEFAEDEPDCECTEKSCDCEEEDCDCECACSKARREPQEYVPPDTFWYDN